MTTTFNLSADELDQSFLDKLRSLFAHKQVEIVVYESEMDTTDYLFSNPVNRAYLERAMANVDDGKNLIELPESSLA